ncbi:uncharacterized protein GIQ15_02502 [Arthroderma uncinatum]|uniref:uncharacterized protein n=1 Tax=Arthroderma uncinatum TaxID=74035 RepID=UPI00144A4E93|nr:uncharacterized protein GIQ15_02502 [Arthroderma uncinatum]KAF3483178.1 hypothetical protein GIQ15_02502 [Arthroderma uncinatum]
MSAPKRLFLSDEELGKKYDDHNRPNSIYGSSIMNFWRRLPRRRRIALAITVALLLFIFFRHVPTRTRDISDGHLWSHPQYDSYTDSEPLETDNTPDEDGVRYYRGLIEFESLLASLYSSRSWGDEDQDAVVFATGELKFLGDILPVACDMASRERNKVHLAIMGREEIPLADVQRANAFIEEDCPIVWHDARPDHASSSSPWRLELSVKAAMVHMYRVLNPRAIITRDAEHEESFFMDAVEFRAYQMRMTHIALPSSMSNFKWIADLDSSSLEAWNDVQTEILINAPPASSGSLRKLLKDLQHADYFGPAPGLTIELPVDADPTLLKYLKTFRWPPRTGSRHFTLRRRVSPSVMTSQEAAVRAVDSFYPKDSSRYHVLVVSPNTELAPSFFHFLKYSLLKYKYCAKENIPAHLVGISLEMPSSRPTDGKPLSVPKSITKSTSAEARKDELPTLLWQMPNSNAVLYFGDKWLEFQSFLSNRLAPSIQAKQKTPPKVITKAFPSWMDYMLEFMRARAYYLTYPEFATQGDLALATVHNELYQPPEEYDDPKQQQVESNFDEKDLAHSPSTITTLLDIYPGSLPDIRELSVLPYTGEIADVDDFMEKRDSFRRTFRKDIGGCTDGDDIPKIVPLKADDLFCQADITKEGLDAPI